MVRRPPKITENIQINPVPGVLGASVELKCIADGYPKPSISWKRDNDGILPAGGRLYNGSILKINDVSKADRGLYYCVANNNIGTPDTRSVNFDVDFPPKISVARPRVAQALDYDIELECKVEGYPAPSVEWYKNGVQLYNENDYRYKITLGIKPSI